MTKHTNHIHLHRRFTPPSKIKWSPPRKLARTLIWTPPQHCASQGAFLQHTPDPESLPISQPSKPQLYYYGLYGGSSLPEKPILFGEPAQAAAWSLSRFHRDGLANIYGPRQYPEWIYHVGTVTLSTNAELEKVPIPSNRESIVETSYWKTVPFYSANSSSISTSKYTKLNKAKMDEIIATFHPTPCYQMSSSSIYKSKCPSSGNGDVNFVKSQSISSRLRSLVGDGNFFIQIEQPFRYIKTAVPSHNIGKMLFLLIQLSCIIYAL